MENRSTAHGARAAQLAKRIDATNEGLEPVEQEEDDEPSPPERQPSGHSVRQCRSAPRNWNWKYLEETNDHDDDDDDDDDDNDDDDDDDDDGDDGDDEMEDNDDRSIRVVLRIPLS